MYTSPRVVRSRMLQPANGEGRGTSLPKDRLLLYSIEVPSDRVSSLDDATNDAGKQSQNNE